MSRRQTSTPFTGMRAVSGIQHRPQPAGFHAVDAYRSAEPVGWSLPWGGPTAKRAKAAEASYAAARTRAAAVATAYVDAKKALANGTTRFQSPNSSNDQLKTLWQRFHKAGAAVQKWKRTTGDGKCALARTADTKSIPKATLKDPSKKKQHKKAIASAFGECSVEEGELDEQATKVDTLKRSVAADRSAAKASIEAAANTRKRALDSFVSTLV